MNKFKKTLYPAIIILFCAFSFQGNPPSGWYLQTLPNVNGRPISDMTFTDSLTGYIVTPYTANDTAYILKTINGGDNWNITLRGATNIIGGFNRIQFVNQTTGFACGNFLWKTTNAGENWSNINTSEIFPENMHILNEDTIWLTDANALVGGVFRTTNGGLNWTQQLNLGSSNPNKIYMFNSGIGFITKFPSDPRVIRKTTNGGATWNTIINNEDFMDIHFADSLTGWKCSAFGMKKTTDGGLNWITQTIPSAGTGSNSFIASFSNINKDTIWGSGGYTIFPNIRGILYRTTNGGTNWLAQIPNTSINIGQYWFMNFINKNNGWAYSVDGRGIHTVSGGDTNFLSSISQISSVIPTDFILKQNYPNPFNPTTNVGFRISKFGFVKLNIYDINGKLIETLVNQNLSAGEYKVTWSAKDLPSGTYFYTLKTDNFTETKKMLLLK